MAHLFQGLSNIFFSNSITDSCDVIFFKMKLSNWSKSFKKYASNLTCYRWEMRWPVSTSMSPSWLSSACKQACGYVLLGNVISSSSTLLCYSPVLWHMHFFWKCCPTNSYWSFDTLGRLAELDQIWGRGPSFAFRGTLGSPVSSHSWLHRAQVFSAVPSSPGAGSGPCLTGGRFPQPPPKSADFFAGVTSVTISATSSFAP